MTLICRRGLIPKDRVSDGRATLFHARPRTDNSAVTVLADFVCTRELHGGSAHGSAVPATDVYVARIRNKRERRKWRTGKIYFTSLKEDLFNIQNTTRFTQFNTFFPRISSNLAIQFIFCFFSCSSPRVCKFGIPYFPFHNITYTGTRDLLHGFWVGWLDLLTLSAIAIQVTVTHTSVLSLLHSPLVVSWQRFHDNLTLTSSHTWSFLCTA
jgi:hypothetical protein